MAQVAKKNFFLYIQTFKSKGLTLVDNGWQLMTSMRISIHQ